MTLAESRLRQSSGNNGYPCIIKFMGASLNSRISVPGRSLERFVSSFESDRVPVEVNFRSLAKGVVGFSRSPHAIHPYPAKLLVNIPKYFLSELSVKKGDVLLDPFCGSGTVLYEGAAAGLHPVGSDSNPLARLITLAKLSRINRAVAEAELALVLESCARIEPSIPDVVHREYWFSERVTRALGQIRAAIEIHVSPDHRALFDVCLSAVARRLSYADPRLSVPVKINPNRAKVYGARGGEAIRRFERLTTIDTGAVFWEIASQNIRRCTQSSLAHLGDAKLQLYDDARSLGVPDCSVDLAITSPPYVGAQKYVRASSLSLGWLGLTPGSKLRPIEQQSIGRENLNASEQLSPEGTGIVEADALLAEIASRNLLRARIAQRYLLEMADAMKELSRVMKDGAILVLVVGPNLVSGLEFPTPYFLERMAHQVGFVTKVHLIDSIDSRGLMTKRNRTAGLIQQESVLLLMRDRSNG